MSSWKWGYQLLQPKALSLPPSLPPSLPLSLSLSLSLWVFVCLSVYSSLSLPPYLSVFVSSPMYLSMSVCLSACASLSPYYSFFRAKGWPMMKTMVTNPYTALSNWVVSWSLIWPRKELRYLGLAGPLNDALVERQKSAFRFERKLFKISLNARLKSLLTM